MDSNEIVELAKKYSEERTENSLDALTKKQTDFFEYR